MAGRPKMKREPIFASIEIESEYGMKFAIKDVVISCPDCNTKQIAEDGMRRRKDTLVQGYKCLNPDCKAKRGTKSAR